MRSAKPSLAELRAVCQPPELTARYSAEHWAGTLYGRRLSIYITWLLVRTRLSANTVTVAMALVGAAGAGLFTVRSVWAPITGAVLIQLYLVLDCSDGELARWRGTTGATGIFLDRLGHYVVEATLFVAMGIRAGSVADLRGGAWSGWFVLGLTAALLHVLGKAETDLVHVARAKAGLPPVADDERTAAPRASGLAVLRRAARLVPIYRLTGAVEASVIALAATLIDEIGGGRGWTEGFVIASVIVTGVVAAGHLLMILASNRLK